MSLLATATHHAGAAVAPVLRLADDTDTGDEVHKAGPIAIVVIIVLAVACFFLFRSMSARMRRVRDSYADPSRPMDDQPRRPDLAPPPPPPARAGRGPGPRPKR